MTNKIVRFLLNLALGIVATNVLGAWLLTAGSPYLIGGMVLALIAWGCSWLIDDWLAVSLNLELSQLRAWQILSAIVLLSSTGVLLWIG